MIVPCFISLGETIHLRISSDLSRSPTPSRGVFLFPLPSIEWHIMQCCAAYTLAPSPAAAGSPPPSRARSGRPQAHHRNRATHRFLIFIVPPPWLRGRLRYHSARPSSIGPRVKAGNLPQIL